MGLLDRFRKEEKLHIDPETRETSWVSTKGEPETKEIKELTYEEQMEPKRQHPWQTTRGKRVIKGAKEGVKRVDKAIVKYNRRQPPPSSRRMKPSHPSSYSTQNNYNPFGSMFDTGMSHKPISFDPIMNYNRPSTKKKKTSKTKYHVVGSKAYPIVGTGKKKKKKSTKHKRRSGQSYDVFNAFGGYKL